MDYKIVIPVIAIVAVLFTSGITLDAFADHNNPTNRDKSAYLFTISGNGGGKYTAGGNDAFVRNNNGVVHYSGYNWINEGAVNHGGGSAGSGGCITPHEAGGWHPPYAKIGNPKGWTSNVNQYYGLFHNGQFNVPPLPEVNSQSKLLLMGYSFGGGATAMIATDPRNSDVRFDLVYTNDPVGPNGVRFNAIANVGYEHSNDPCFGGGHSGNTIWDTPCLIPQEFLVTLPTYAICVLDQQDRDDPWRVFKSNVQYLFNRVQVGWIPPADVLVTPNSFAHSMPLSWVSQAEVSSDTIINNSSCLSFGDSILDILFDGGSLPMLIACGHGYMGSLDTTSYTQVENVMKSMNTGPAITTTEFFVDEGAELIQVTGDDLPTRWDISNLMELTYRLDPQVDLGLQLNINHPYNVLRTQYSSATANLSTHANLPTPNFDGPSVQIKELQVEDNGFPCNNCTDLVIDDNGSAVSDCTHVTPEEAKLECIEQRLSDDSINPTSGLFNGKGAFGMWDNQNITIHVANVAPTVTFTKEPVFQSMNLHLTLSTTDPSDADTAAGFDYEIDWGDGPSEIIHGDAEQVFNHTYKFGKYTIKVTATDKDGGVSQEISIDVQTPFVRLLDDIDDLINDGTLNPGQGNSLKQKINAIGRDLEKNNLTPACNVVDAFYNELNAFVNAGILTEQQRDDLIATTEIEKDTVGCNGKVIVVEKQIVPPSPLEFTFTGDVAGSIGDDQEIRVRNLTAGEYSSTEISIPFFPLTDITCSDESSSGDLLTKTSTFRVEADEFWVKCTFTNIFSPFPFPFSNENESEIGRGSSSASDLANAQARFNSFSGQPSDNITDDKKGSGGDEHLTRPTFGLSHETFETIVDSGFRFNDQSFTINDNHHTPFAQQTVNIGEINTFEAKIYADKGLKVQEFLFGIPNVGKAHLAELGVEVWYDHNGEIEEVKAIQKSNVIDKETIVVTHEKTKCQALDIDEKCDLTNVSVVFLEPLKDKVMAVKAIDYKNRYQITYLNEGVEIAGESLNPMNDAMIPSTIRNEGLIKVTQTAKYSPYWLADDGRLFEMNSFGSFKQINQTFERFEDTGNPYTRLHSGFGGIISYEQKRATQLFNSTEYISQLPESFAYIFPESGERITEEMKAKMFEQEEIAKKIIEESKVQARW